MCISLFISCLPRDIKHYKTNLGKKQQNEGLQYERGLHDNRNGETEILKVKRSNHLGLSTSCKICKGLLQTLATLIGNMMMSHWDSAIPQVLDNNCWVMGHDRAGECPASQLQNGWFFPLKCLMLECLGSHFE